MLGHHQGDFDSPLLVIREVVFAVVFRLRRDTGAYLSSAARRLTVVTRAALSITLFRRFRCADPCAVRVLVGARSLREVGWVLWGVLTLL